MKSGLMMLAVLAVMRGPGPDREVHRAITIAGEPRSFQVVRIPVPAQLRGQDTVHYEIAPETPFRVIGVRAGQLHGPSARGDVVITLGVPADALAGSRIAARALFRAGEHTIEVPIEMRVLPIYRITLRGDEHVEDIRAADRIEVSFVVNNEGNATDTVRLVHQLPTEWRRARDTTIVLAAHTHVTRTLRITVPSKIGAGAFFLRTKAVSRGDSVNIVTTMLVGPSDRIEAPPGPTVRTVVSSVAVPGAATQTLSTLVVHGPLTNGINIEASGSTNPPLTGPAARALARIGAYAAMPHIGAWHDTWHFDAGNTLVNIGDLTGVNAAATGVSFDYDNRRDRFSLMAGRPTDANSLRTDNSLFGVSYAHAQDKTSISVSAARLRDEGGPPRSLSAVGLQIATPLFGAEAFGGLAYREFADGNGIGWRGGFRKETQRMGASVRLVHAPGGIHAFARAEDELDADFRRRLSDRLDVSIAVHTAQDAHALDNTFKTRAASFTARFRLSTLTTVRADARTSTFDGNAENHVGVSFNAQMLGVNVGSDLGVDYLTRTPSGNGQRITWRGTAERTFTFGELVLESSYDRTSGSAFVPEQLMVNLAARRAQLPFGPQNLYIDAEAGISNRFAMGTAATLRGSAIYAISPSIDLQLSAERNPLYYAATRQVPWVVAVRIAKSLGLPRWNTHTGGGVVFQDNNGNGRREPGEPGMPNIVVQRGRARSISDRDGRYHLAENARGQLGVDAASLPYGWIAGERTDGDNIPVVPTARLEVLLELRAAERLRKVDLAPAAVIARDATGREWLASSVGFKAVFEALPVGDYEIDVDFSGVAEPMRIDGPAPHLTLTREGMNLLTVPVAGRPLRFVKTAEKP